LGQVALLEQVALKLAARVIVLRSPLIVQLLGALVAAGTIMIPALGVLAPAVILTLKVVAA
jgi:hypothetical protein